MQDKTILKKSMSPLKKGIILQKKTVETVGLFGLCFINPQLKLGVNSKLRRHRTVLTVSIITRWIQLLMLFLADSSIIHILFFVSFPEGFRKW